MTEAYTVSKMLASINKVMAPVATEPHASVSLKRQLSNGVMLDTSAKEIAYLDLQSKVKHSAQEVAQLERQDKLQWVEARRERGNDAFRRGEYEQAAELYVEALTGLDFGTSEEQRRTCQEQLQLPLTCNLAACMLMTEQWLKAKQMCDQAIQLDRRYVRARQQRAKALVGLCRFDDAKRDVHEAILNLKSTSWAGAGDERVALQNKLQNQLRSIERSEQRNRKRELQQRQFEKQMMREAVGRLYEDKTEQASGLPPDAASREHHQYDLAVATDTLYFWVANTLAMLLVLVRRMLAAVMSETNSKTK